MTRRLTCAKPDGSEPGPNHNFAHTRGEAIPSMDDLSKRLLRLVLAMTVAAIFLGGLSGMVWLWFRLMDPYG